MSKQQEALRLALEALEEINKLSIGENAICLPAEIDTAMDAIQSALAEQPAQPCTYPNCPYPCPDLPDCRDAEKAQQQEPVKACVTGQCPCKSECDSAQCCLYTAPQPSKPLTNDRVWLEYMQLWPFRPNEEPTLAKDILRFARAIEAAHGIKGDV